jgi:hypothetical protein
MRSRAPILPTLALAAALTAAGCSSNGDPVSPAPSGPGPRAYRMGFSGIPARPDFAQAIAAIQMWTARADGAIFAITPPWDSLLAGVPADSLLLRDQKPLADYYHARGLELVVTLDATDGLNRAADAPELVAAGRSLAEPAVQALYRAYAVAVDTLLRPAHLALAMETNLIRAAAPPSLYAAVVAAANGAAADVRARDAAVRLSVSVQVETAWNRLGAPAPGPPTYSGVAQDVADFPFAQEFGLSSYPFLGGFAEPEDVPLGYFKRVRDEVGRPVLLVEGGWTSATVTGPGITVVSDAAKQARWWRRQIELADQAPLAGLYQLSFTDLDLATFPPQPPGSILPLFARLGVVDADLAPKPALAVYDSAFARRRSDGL